MSFLIPAAWFAAMGLLFALLLAVASRVFAVKQDPRVDRLSECLPGANCGGCGYTGCTAYAEAVAKGTANIGDCTVGGTPVAKAMGEVMGVEVGEVQRMRAQVMCSGTTEFAKKKYVYAGAHDCVSAARLGGGDRLCPNGCIGLGTCTEICPQKAITVENGVAVVDYHLCNGCGKCTAACPKGIIRLIPFESAHWVGCMSHDKGAETRTYCDVGCIACKLCERVCPTGAITVNEMTASVDYTKCNDCGACVAKCPRKIIWSAKSQKDGLVIVRVKTDASANV